MNADLGCDMNKFLNHWAQVYITVIRLCNSLNFILQKEKPRWLDRGFKGETTMKKLAYTSKGIL